MDADKVILVIGQVSLHWGRLEFGNIGNYYIIEPFFRELHRAFPGYRIKTTCQLTERFCVDEGVTVLPMELYYGFRDNELQLAEQELRLAEKYKTLSDNSGIELTPYISEVLNSEIIIDLSGDMWSDNANLSGKNRFRVGIIKDYIAELFRPTVLLASSPGPFENVGNCLELAKKVYSDFKLVINREGASRRVLQYYGFDLSHTIDSVCPSFLYEPVLSEEMVKKLRDRYLSKNRINIGVILCGFNFSEPPFSKWPRDDSEYTVFVQVIKHILCNYNANIVLLSHANGFPIPPQEFKLLHAKDYDIAERVMQLLSADGFTDNVRLVEEVLQPWDTKMLIGQLDVLLSGRIHGAVAGLSQAVPTVIIDYGMEPKAHKHRGIAELVGCEKYMVDPKDALAFEAIADEVIENREMIHSHLIDILPNLKGESHKQFDLIASVVGK